MNYFLWFTSFVFTVVDGKSNLVLLVLDGLNNDYLANPKYPQRTPNLNSIINDGIYLNDITPEFPASRLPFLTSLVTGRHAQEHGVLGNEVYDEKSKSVWKVEDDTDLFWEKAQKITNIWV